MPVIGEQKFGLIRYHNMSPFRPDRFVYNLNIHINSPEQKKMESMTEEVNHTLLGTFNKITSFNS